MKAKIEHVCNCTSCDNPIEFTTDQNGTSVNCPHCGAFTLLTVPRRTATKVRVVKDTAGGLESKLERTGTAIFVAGFVIGSGIIIDGFSNGDAPNFILIGIGLVVFAQIFIVELFFLCCAEVVRLLKRQNGIPFSGTISEANGAVSVTCSLCGWNCSSSVTGHEAQTCYGCKAEFEN